MDIGKIVLSTILILLLTGAYAQDRLQVQFLDNPGVEKAKSEGALSPLAFHHSIKRGGSIKQWSKEAAFKGENGIRIKLSKDSGPYMTDMGWQASGLNPDELYRFSVQYRTVDTETNRDVMRMLADKYYLAYPANKSWSPASICFQPAKENCILKIFFFGLKNGYPQYKKDENGKRKLCNRSDIQVDLDNFDLKQLSEKDYKQQLIENGSFEIGDGFPAGWRQYMHYPQNPIVLTETEGMNGKHCLRINIEPGNRGEAVYSNYMPMMSGSIYQVTFRMKAAAERVGSVFVRLTAKNNNTKYIWKERIKPNKEWNNYEFFVETPKEGGLNYQGKKFLSSFCIWLYEDRKNSQKQSIWIDDVKIQIPEGM